MVKDGFKIISCDKCENYDEDKVQCKLHGKPVAKNEKYVVPCVECMMDIKKSYREKPECTEQ